MNNLQTLFVKTACLKYKVDFEKIQSLLVIYLDMFKEVLENNSEVPDTLVRQFSSEEASDIELRILGHLLKTLYGLPVTFTRMYGSVVFETSLVAYPLEIK